MSTVPLHFRQFGPDGAPVVVVLHGLLGSADNWGTVARELAEPTAEGASPMQVLLVDQRDHGRSPHTDDISYPIMAADVQALAEDLGLRDILLVGHSMGGKTAMAFAQQWPSMLRGLVVVDISPREHTDNHSHILEALTTADLGAGSTRAEVEAHLARYVKEPGVVQFLMKNLYWQEPGKLGWRVNVPLLKEKLPAILAAIGPERVQVPALFIRGGQSDYILREDLPAIREQFPAARVETVPFAGHWVHAQAPDEVVALIRSMP